MTRTQHLDIEHELLVEIDRARAASDRFVIIDSGPYYVQLMPNLGALYGEAVSNAYLHGSERLTPAQEARLVADGWSWPEVPCHPDCPRPHPGFTRVWGPGVPSRQIAREMLGGLIVLISGAGEGAAPIVVKSDYRKTQPTSGPVPGH